MSQPIPWPCPLLVSWVSLRIPTSVSITFPSGSAEFCGPAVSRSEVCGKAGRHHGSGPGLWVCFLQGPCAPSPEPCGVGGSPWSLQLQVLPTMIRDVGSEVFKALSVLSEASVGFI